MKKQSWSWRVTLEHRNGSDQHTFYPIAQSGYQAQHFARAMLESKGIKAHYYTMIGLARLTS